MRFCGLRRHKEGINVRSRKVFVTERSNWRLPCELKRRLEARATLASVVFALTILAGLSLGRADETSSDQRLPNLGPAPDFALISQDGVEVTLEALHGKVVAVTFIYTWCPDICPTLTDKMSRVQDALGSDFATNVAFASITFDPEHDTPEVLKTYAQAFGANFKGWSFLTGDPAAVREVVRRYGVSAIPAGDGSIDHNLLTTLIDRQGIMRVQYIGYRFDPEEFRRDLLRLVNEP
jgi:protein SCO1/2